MDCGVDHTGPPRGTVWGISGVREPILPLPCPWEHWTPERSREQLGGGWREWQLQPLPSLVQLLLLVEALTFLLDPRAE